MSRQRGKTVKYFTRARYNVVYLLHLEVPLTAETGHKKKQAQHYIGSCPDLYKRWNEHRGDNDPAGWKRRGANFLWNCNIRGIRFFLVRTWKAPCDTKKGCRLLEVEIKRRRRHAVLCPVCTGKIPLPQTHILEKD